MKRFEAVYKGLQYQTVWKQDTTPTSPDYFQISEFPQRLTSGKNLIKLRGNPTALRPGSYLNFEVLDYNGDPIYSEVINYIDEDKSRVIAIYIYETTPPGDCTITLIGEAVNVPEEWENRGNVKWTRTVPVNPNAVNDTEIIYTTIPQATIQEQVSVQYDRSYTNGIQFPVISGSARFFNIGGQPAIEITGTSLPAAAVNGTFTVTSPQNPLPNPTYPVSNTGYTAQVSKVLSPTLALLKRGYTANSSQSIFTHEYTEFDQSAFTLQYEATPIYTPTQNSESFALIQLDGLEPATGDVARIKTFMNSAGTVGTWELINDIELTETEIFVSNTASTRPYEPVAIFYSQSIIDTYWSGSTWYSGNTVTPPTLTWSNTTMNNAMRIQSNAAITAENQITVVNIRPEYAGRFVENGSYRLVLDAIGTRIDAAPPRISFYLSGSAFNTDTTDYFNNQFGQLFGQRIGELTVTGDSRRFISENITFTAPRTGTAVLVAIIESGEWQLADITTTPDVETGFTPQYTRIRTLVPTQHKSGNQLAFRFEYYTVAGAKSRQHTEISNVVWRGGNRYVDGDYSMLTGSLYVADSLESGVAISGYKNTGYIRSLGYEGFAAEFPGFLIWSGSALSGSLGTKGGVPYSGVGLELYANTASYFRYSTADSEIDVRTDSFFFGKLPTPFISGANGNIEISASNFHLSTEGNVTASNALFTGVALANIIRDKTITITAANSSSYIDSIGVNLIFPQSGSRINLDGSLGGEIVRRIIIDCDLANPLARFRLPQIDDTAKIDVIVEFARANNIYNVFSTKNMLIPANPPDQIEITSGSIINFAPFGNSAQRMIVQYGTEMPMDYVFKRDVTITGSLSLPNRAAFRVSGSSVTGISATTTITSTQGAVIDYNQGNHYNNTSGIFTVPDNGMYHVYLNCRVQVAGSQQVIVYKNNTIPMLVWEAANNTGAVHFGVSGVLKLAVGDTLRAKVVVGTVQFDSNDSWGAAFIG